MPSHLARIEVVSTLITRSFGSGGVVEWHLVDECWTWTEDIVRPCQVPTSSRYYHEVLRLRLAMQPMFLDRSCEAGITEPPFLFSHQPGKRPGTTR